MKYDIIDYEAPGTQGQTNVQNVRHGDIADIYNQHDKSLY